MRRFLDIVVLLLALPILFPLLFFAFLIKLMVDGNPVFYNSVRLGKSRVPILVFKFRTMVVDRDFVTKEVKRYSDGGFEAIPLSSSVYTSIGRVYERTQLVETPQIINVIRGEMSFVGYRPLPISHYELLCQNVGEHLTNLRFAHQPGLTGIAQLFGKSNLTYMQRVQIEINEGLFYDSNGMFFHKFVLYFYSLIGTLFYLLLGKAPLVGLVYKKIIVRNLVAKFH